MKQLLLLALCAAVSFAADVTGNWKANYTIPNADVQAERTFVFKTEGEKVSGETNSQFTGKSTIDDGKLSGDTLTFTVKAQVQGNEIKLKYTGKVEGTEIKFRVESDGGEFSMDYVAKKQN